MRWTKVYGPEQTGWLAKSAGFAAPDLLAPGTDAEGASGGRNRPLITSIPRQEGEPTDMIFELAAPFELRCTVVVKQLEEALHVAPHGGSGVSDPQLR